MSVTGRRYYTNIRSLRGDGMGGPESELEALVGSDLILLLLAAPSRVSSAKDRIHGVTRLEKLLFLADKETDIAGRVEDAFRFRPYHYGPYSKELYEAVELLEEAGLISEERVYEGRTLDEMEEATAGQLELEGTERRFLLTPDGKAVAGLLAEHHKDVTKALAGIKERYAAMPLRRLIRYVYGAYPDYAEASRIKDQF
jgi:hypothetical protein